MSAFMSLLFSPVSQLLEFFLVQCLSNVARNKRNKALQNFKGDLKKKDFYNFLSTFYKTSCVTSMF